VPSAVSKGQSGAGNGRNLDFGEVLPMPVMTLIVLAPLEFDHFDFLSPTLGENSAGHFATIDQRGTHFDFRALADQENLVEFDRVSHLGVETLDAQPVALTGAVLLAAGSKYCVHLEDAPGLVGPAAGSRKGREF
jgi:hypothetical protein